MYGNAGPGTVLDVSYARMNRVPKQPNMPALSIFMSDNQLSNIPAPNAHMVPLMGMSRLSIVISYGSDVDYWNILVE